MNEAAPPQPPDGSNRSNGQGPPHPSPDVGAASLPDPTSGVLLPPPELDQRVPAGSKEWVMQKMYAAPVQQGDITHEEAEQAAGDSVEIVRQLDDEALVEANRGAAEVLESMESWENRLEVDPTAVMANFDDLLAAYKAGDAGALEDIRGFMGITDQALWDRALHNLDRAAEKGDPGEQFGSQDAVKLAEDLFMPINDETDMERYEQAEEAFISIGRALETLPYIDSDRAAHVYELALSKEGNTANALEGVAKGLANFTLIRGSDALPLWEEALAVAAGDKEKEDVITLGVWSAAARLHTEIQEEKRDPEIDPEAIDIDETLLADLKKLVRDTPQPSPPVSERHDATPPSPEQQRETFQRLKPLVGTEGIKGDGRWN